VWETQDQFDPMAYGEGLLEHDYEGAQQIAGMMILEKMYHVI